MQSKKALIMVDLQNDFCAGGALAVPAGDEVVALANHLQRKFKLIVATKDWHPANHVSFAINHINKQVGETTSVDGLEQILWPAHCIQDNHGAELHPHLEINAIDKLIYKGVDKNIDSYSAFFDNAHRRSTGLGDYLREHHITDVYILGLATDYCVKYSVLDAIDLGFNVYVIEDACRGVELTSGDIKAAYAEMIAAGAKIVKAAEIT